MGLVEGRFLGPNPLCKTLEKKRKLDVVEECVALSSQMTVMWIC